MISTDYRIHLIFSWISEPCKPYDFGKEGRSLLGIKKWIYISNYYIIIKVIPYHPQVSGVSNEIFRQIEMVENDHDSTTAAALEVSTESFTSNLSSQTSI